MQLHMLKSVTSEDRFLSLALRIDIMLKGHKKTKSSFINM